ncbi:MAG: hypothetical protein U9O78_03705, partial [Patescibacteria group bacterium]|nr:hypothetical protein [Patescibacteria group bacterium]
MEERQSKRLKNPDSEQTNKVPPGYKKIGPIGGEFLVPEQDPGKDSGYKKIGPIGHQVLVPKSSNPPNPNLLALPDIERVTDSGELLLPNDQITPAKTGFLESLKEKSGMPPREGSQLDAPIILSSKELAKAFENPVSFIIDQISVLFELDPNPRYSALTNTLKTYATVVLPSAVALDDELTSLTSKRLRLGSDDPLIMPHLLLTPCKLLKFDKKLQLNIEKCLTSLKQKTNEETKIDNVVTQLITFFESYLKIIEQMRELNLDIIEPLFNRVMNVLDNNKLGENEIKTTLNILLNLLQSYKDINKLIYRIPGTTKVFASLVSMLTESKISKDMAYSFLENLELANAATLEKLLVYMDEHNDLQHPLAFEIYLRLQEVNKDAIFVREQQKRKLKLLHALSEPPVELIEKFPTLKPESEGLVSPSSFPKDESPQVGLEIECALEELPAEFTIAEILRMRLPPHFEAHQDGTGVTEITRKKEALPFDENYVRQLVALMHWLENNTQFTEKTVHLHTDRDGKRVPDFGVLFIRANSLGTNEYRELKPPVWKNTCNIRSLVTLIDFVVKLTDINPSDKDAPAKKINLEKPIENYSKQELFFTYLCAFVDDPEARLDLLVLLSSNPEIFNTLLSDEFDKCPIINQISWMFDWPDKVSQIDFAKLPIRTLIFMADKLESDEVTDLVDWLKQQAKYNSNSWMKQQSIIGLVDLIKADKLESDEVTDLVDWLKQQAEQNSNSLVKEQFIVGLVDLAKADKLGPDGVIHLVDWL